MEGHNSQTSDSSGKFPIAIVGIGCRMPGGVTSPEEFWDVLVKGRDMVTDIPPDRWSIESFYHKNQSVHNKMVTKRCGFIQDIDKFDNSFFQISPREAASMDPQQRHMLEVAYEAFQDAGIVPSTCGDCGVYIAVGRMDYPIMIMDTSITNPYTLTGIAHSVVANRISYVFNFKGPSLVVDTACASSFTAMHLACSSLWNGECSIVLAGGANPVIIPEVTVGYSALGVLSPEGMSCPFSDTAKGYVRSEGWGGFILKPLESAVRNNDHVYAVIRGSAIACNGTSKSLTMPCSQTQKMVMRMAYEKFNIPMSSVKFVEAHGTGTPVGDPIEATAIGETFGSLNKEPIAIGSVKSNFGHTECASGVTSAIKVALMLQNRQLVPSINFRNINPSINLKRLNIRVQTCNEPIKDAEEPFRVGLNSFGFAGAVAHMIFEEAPKKQAQREVPKAGWKLGNTESKKGNYVTIPISAKCPEALNDLAKKWIKFSSDVDALQISSWQATRREHHTYKLAVVADSSDTFRGTLTSFLQDEIKETLVKGDDTAHCKPKICFVFPGQGQQWYNMGRQLYQNETVFRDTINECDRIFKELSGWSLIEKTGVFNGISSDKANSPDIIEEVEILQPTIHFFQIALFHIWKHWGIHPHYVVGHSLGEIAAAYAAGAISLKEAISVVYYRAAQQATLSGTGSMAAVRSGRETAEAICKSYPDVNIAAINGPGSVTISGDCDHIASIVKSNVEKARQLRVSAAYHTQFMSPIEGEFRKSMQNVIKSDSSNRAATFYSTVTGECYTDPLNVDYWWQNIRRPVLFQSAIESILLDTDVSIFLEVSATATLRSDVQKIIHFNDPMRQISLVASGRRNANDQMYALLALGNLYTAGVNINWNEVTHNAAQWAPIPTYPWQHQQSLWIEAEDHQKVRLGMDDRSFKGKNGYITTDTFPYLSEYFEDDVLVFPSSGFLKYASEIVFRDRKAAFENVQFLKPLIWSTDSSHRQTALRLDMKRVGYQIEITEKEISYFKATISDTDDIDIARQEAEFDTDGILDRCSTYLSKEDFYHQLQVTGITTETSLQVVDEVYLGDSESVTHVDVESLTNRQQAFIAVLNSAFQVASVTVQQTAIKYRPIGLEYIFLQPSFFAAEEGNMIFYTDVVDCDGHFVMSNILIMSDSGSVMGFIKNLECHNVDKRISTFDIQKCLFTTQWQPVEACNLSTSTVPETFEEPQMSAICGKDANAIKRAEEMADDIENICVSYIKHALDTVPDIERAKGKRYHKYMAIFDAVQARYTKNVTPYDKIPEVMDKVLAHCPELDVEMHLAKRLGEALPDTLRNPHTCVPIMFSADCLDRYFWDGLSMKVYYEAAANAVVRSVKKAFKTKQVVRVLELGGRIGGFTRFVVEPLKQFGMANRLEYVFTDVSATFFTQARAKLPGYPFIQYQLLSVEKDVAEQGFVPSSFDIVICVDTLHVAVDARRSTSFMRDLLVPNGHLYIIEGTNTHFLTELWFGTMDVCLIFEDERTQILNKSCWFHREGWMQVMRDIGMQDVVSGSTKKEFYHSVMVGRKPSSVTVKPINGIGMNEQNSAILIFEDGTKLSPEIQHRGNKSNAQMINATLGEEMIVALQGMVTLQGMVKLKPFSEIRQLAKTLKKRQQPFEIIFVCRDEDEDFKTLLDLLQILGTFQRKLNRVWVVVKTKENHLTANSGSVVGLVQSLCNRARSVPLYSLHLAATSSFKRVAKQIAILQSQSLLPEHHFFISKSGSLEVPRVANHHIETAETVTPEHWMAKFLSESDMPENLVFFGVDEMAVPTGHVKIRIESIPLCGMNAPQHHQQHSSGSSDVGAVAEIQCLGTIEAMDDMDDGMDLEVGDEVIGFGQIALASHVICDSKLVIPNTSGVDCTGLIPLVTAYYSLLQRARVSSTDTVLICSDNVPLCLAALEVVKYIKCQVICIAVDSQNEDFLKDRRGVERVVQMSSSSFAESVMNWTNSDGVDVVFLSSTYPNYEKILSVVSPEGRLCEVSRNNMLQIAGITSNILMGNKVFHSCQVDILLQHQPERFCKLVLQVMGLLKRNLIDPIPQVECPIEDFLTSYDVKKGNQAEQVVLEIANEFNPLDHVNLQPSEEQFSANASYIVTGAHTNLALSLARWLYQLGATSIVLISHDEFPTSTKQTQKFLRNHKVEVREYIVNLEEQDAAKEVLDDIRSTSEKTIKGVFHLDTIIYNDRPFEIDAKDASKIFNDTIVRARNLHTLTKRDDLDIFVMLSSINSLVGIPSKPLSSAVSAYLDGLAEERNAQGLPALSVQVGPIRCMGTVFGVSETESYQMHFDRRKELIHVDDFLQALGMLLRKPNQRVVCLGAQDWGAMKQMCVNSATKFRHLAKGTKVVKEKPRSATMNKRQIEHVIKSKMADLLCMRIEAIDVKRPMTAYGVDSLIAMEVANWASDVTQLGLLISQFDILDGMTIATLLNKAISS